MSLTLTGTCSLHAQSHVAPGSPWEQVGTSPRRAAEPPGLWPPGCVCTVQATGAVRAHYTTERGDSFRKERNPLFLTAQGGRAS